MLFWVMIEQKLMPIAKNPRKPGKQVHDITYTTLKMQCRANTLLQTLESQTKSNLSHDKNVKYDRHTYQEIQVTPSVVRSVNNSGLQ